MDHPGLHQPSFGGRPQHMMFRHQNADESLLCTCSLLLIVFALNEEFLVSNRPWPRFTFLRCVHLVLFFSSLPKYADGTKRSTTSNRSGSRHTRCRPLSPIHTVYAEQWGRWFDIQSWQQQEPTISEASAEFRGLPAPDLRPS